MIVGIMTLQEAAERPEAVAHREASAFIQDCLNGHHGRKHQAAAERVYVAARHGRWLSDSVRIADAVRGLANAQQGW